MLSHAILQRSLPVYNIEVHGEHVYQVGVLGVLVHNSYADDFAKKASEAFQKLTDLRENLAKLRAVKESVRSSVSKGDDFLFDFMKQERLQSIAELEKSLLKQIADATADMDFWL